MPLFGIGAPVRGGEDDVFGGGQFSFFGEEVGILSSDGSRILPVAETGISYPDMNTLIAEHLPEEMETLRQAAAVLDSCPDPENEEADTSDLGEEDTCRPSFLRNGLEARILSPIPVPLQDVICLGLNYTEHAEEAAAYSSAAFTSKDRYPQAPQYGLEGARGKTLNPYGPSGGASLPSGSEGRQNIPQRVWPG